MCSNQAIGYLIKQFVFSISHFPPFFLSDCLDLNVMYDAGIPEQASELGVRTVAAHWPCHGHREHPALRRLQ